MAGLIVTLYDKELIFQERLGGTETDEEGAFSIVYRLEFFRELFQARPDKYLKVLSEEGKTLYSSEKAVRFEAGRVEVFDVKIATTE